MKISPPMLAATVDDVKKLRLPLLASAKLDGIRAMIVDGYLVSRNGKLIPNKAAQVLFGHHRLNGLDGELIVGEPTAKDCFRATSSAVMSQLGEPAVKLYVFDYIASNVPFIRRFEVASELSANIKDIRIVPHFVMESLDELLVFEEYTVSKGYEGVMLRSLDGTYKHGRSTLLEQGLLKLKRFTDGEALIIGAMERMHNGNVATLDSFGHIERSSHQEHMRGRGDLGALLVRDLQTGVEFSIGTGFDDALRVALWHNKPIGKVVKYKHFPIGAKDKPRFPVFLGFRDERDMS